MVWREFHRILKRFGLGSVSVGKYGHSFQRWVQTVNQLCLLLIACGDAARESGQVLHGIKVGDDDTGPLFSSNPAMQYVESNPDAHSGYTGGVIGGTAWLFSRPEWEAEVDFLFIDESGQVSLANAVAMARSRVVKILSRVKHCDDHGSCDVLEFGVSAVAGRGVRCLKRRRSRFGKTSCPTSRVATAHLRGEFVVADYAAFLSNDCTSPPTYDRTSILSRVKLTTSSGGLPIGGR